MRVAAIISASTGGDHTLGNRLAQGDLRMSTCTDLGGIGHCPGELRQITFGAVTPPLANLVGLCPHATKKVRASGIYIVKLADPGRDQLCFQIFTTCNERAPTADPVNDRHQWLDRETGPHDAPLRPCGAHVFDY